MRLRFRHFVPLIGFLVPSIAIGYGIVLPRDGHSGLDEVTVGYAGTLIGATVTYVAGLHLVRRG